MASRLVTGHKLRHAMDIATGLCLILFVAFEAGRLYERGLRS